MWIHGAACRLEFFQNSKPCSTFCVVCVLVCLFNCSVIPRFFHLEILYYYCMNTEYYRFASTVVLICFFSFLLFSSLHRVLIGADSSTPVQDHKASSVDTFNGRTKRTKNLVHLVGVTQGVATLLRPVGGARHREAEAAAAEGGAGGGALGVGEGEEADYLGELGVGVEGGEGEGEVDKSFLITARLSDAVCHRVYAFLTSSILAVQALLRLVRRLALVVAGLARKRVLAATLLVLRA